MVKHVAVLVSCLIFCLTNLNLISQPTISVEFPSLGATNISVMPEIKIQVNSPYKIDVSCLNTTGFEPDSNWDSVNNRHILSVMNVFPTNYYFGNDSTLQIALLHGNPGKCVLINDTVFKFIPIVNLEYFTNYSFYIDDIRVYNPQTSDTIVLDTLFYPLFLTTKPMYKVEGISPTFGVVRTEDTVNVFFNRELTSDTTILGPLLGLREIIETEINDSTIYSFIDIPHSTWLNTVSNSISILPDSNFTQGKEYLVDVHLYRLTGDSADFYNYLIRIKESAIINITSRCVDSTDTLPEHCGPLCGNKMFFIRANEEFNIEAPKYYGDFFFLGWLCDNNDTINGNRNPKIVINYEPKDLLDLNITAYFARTVKDEIIISSNSTSSFTVFTPGEQLNDSTYTLPRKEGNWMLVRANADSGYVFSNWESSDSSINGKTNANLIISALLDSNGTVAKKNTKIDKIQTDPPWPLDWVECMDMRSLQMEAVHKNEPCGENPALSLLTVENPAFCFIIELLDGTPIYNKGSVEGGQSPRTLSDLIVSAKVGDYEFVGNVNEPNFFNSNKILAQGCKSFYYTNLPITKTMFVQLNSNYTDQYEIAYYEDTDGRFGIKIGRNHPDYNNPLDDPAVGLENDPYGDSVGTELSETVTLGDQNSCRCNLHVVIFRKRCFLSTELEMNDGSKLPYDKIVKLETPDKPSKMEEAKLPNNQTQPIEEFNQEDKKIKAKYIYEVPYGEVVRLKGYTETNAQGYEFYEWKRTDGYRGYPIVSDYLQLTMTQNYNTLAFFNAPFRVTEIGHLSIYPTEQNQGWQMYDMDNGPVYFSDYPENDYNYSAMIVGINRPSKYVNDPSITYVDNNYTFQTTKIKIVFSKDVDESTLIDENLIIKDEKFCFGGMCILGRRCDGEYTKNYSYESHGTYSDKTIEMTLIRDDKGLGIPYMSHFSVEAKEGIKSSIAQENLHIFQGNNMNGLYTEFPSLEIQLEFFNATNGGESEDSYEIVANYFSPFTRDFDCSIYNLEYTTGRLPLTGSYNATGSITTNNSKILFIPRLSYKSMIGFGFIAYEKDGGTTDDNFNNIISTIIDNLYLTAPLLSYSKDGQYFKNCSNEWLLGQFLKDASTHYMTQLKEPENPNERGPDDICRWFEYKRSSWEFWGVNPVGLKILNNVPYHHEAEYLYFWKEYYDPQNYTYKIKSILK